MQKIKQKEHLHDILESLYRKKKPSENNFCVQEKDKTSNIIWEIRAMKRNCNYVH